MTRAYDPELRELEEELSTLESEWRAEDEAFYEWEQGAVQSSALSPGQPCTLISGGRCMRCGSCQACERRIKAAPPAQLMPVPDALRMSDRPIPLDARALQAYQRLYENARAAGIPDPYLRIMSGLRDYNRQTGIWRSKLLNVFQMLGCDSTTLPCLALAIDATNQALRPRPVPHARDMWEQRFRQEIQRIGCLLPCNPHKAIRIARQGVAPPGTSPHHTGRAVDVYVGRAPGAKSSASKADPHVQWQRRQPSYRWLVCNAARFGFYPYQQEPWHWEYNPPSSVV